MTNTQLNEKTHKILDSLLRRTFGMTHRFRNGIIPKQQYTNISADYKALYLTFIDTDKDFDPALYDWLKEIDVFLQNYAPWKIFKEEKTDPLAAEDLDDVLYSLLESLRIIAITIKEKDPTFSQHILSLLFETQDTTSDLPELALKSEWGMLPSGNKIAPATSFPTDKNTDAEKKEDKKCAQKNKKEEAPYATFDDFLKIDLRVAQIVEAERLEKSEKLIKLQINLGEELGGQRQIVAGIAKHYEAEELIGKKIAVVANLKPAKLMGESSQGMLLAASDNSGNLNLVNPGDSIPVGSKIS